jgi:hypothetical protein
MFITLPGGMTQEAKDLLDEVVVQFAAEPVPYPAQMLEAAYMGQFKVPAGVSVEAQGVVHGIIKVIDAKTAILLLEHPEVAGQPVLGGPVDGLVELHKPEYITMPNL